MRTHEISEGQRINQLVAVRMDGRSWVMRCDCGAEKKMRASYLLSGRAKSCGCAWRRRMESFKTENITHGHTKNKKWAPEYRTWSLVRDRCNNPNNRAYCNYGGRGIKVDPRWDASFESFIADVGYRPSPKHSLDRIDNNGNYEPGNVRWATAAEQARNRRTSRLVTYGGITMNAEDWAARIGINSSTMHYRLTRWSIERALTEPPNRPEES